MWEIHRGRRGRRRGGALLGVGLGLAVAAGPAGAERVGIEALTLDSHTSRPNRGMTMSSVESKFGAPSERLAPVGEPPITRWRYGSFTVYFEHDRVIHTVIDRPSSGGG